MIFFDFACVPTPPTPPPAPKSSFAAGKCVKGRVSQQWSLSTGVVPGDGKPTNVLSATHGPPFPGGGCWEIAECRDGGGMPLRAGEPHQARGAAAKQARLHQSSLSHEAASGIA